MNITTQILTEKKFPAAWLPRFTEAFPEGADLNFDNLLRMAAMGINVSWFPTHLCTDYKQAEAYLFDLSELPKNRKPWLKGTIGEEIDLVLKHINSWSKNDNGKE
jgi:hypothetical protein